MAFDMQGVILSQANGEEFSVGADGLMLNQQPVVFHMNGKTFLRDICILSRKKLALLVSADGPGVEVRDEIRRHLAGSFQKTDTNSENSVDPAV